MKKKWFIGIDISKKTLDVVIYDSAKKQADDTNYKCVTNNADGFSMLYAWFKSHKISNSKMVIGMENTGVYGFELRLFLESKGIDYCSLNPLHLKHSFGLVRGKNDKVDAQRIAEYTFLHRDSLTYSKLSSSTILRLQELSAERKRFIKQLAEYKALLTEGKGRQSNATIQRAKQMKDFLETEINSVESDMEELIHNDALLEKNYHLLRSIKGIGSINAISTIIHTNNFEAFQTARQYACYLGIAPFGNTSGTTLRKKPEVCKTGARMLKADLSQAAKSAIVWDKELKGYYERKRKENKAFGVVLNAVKFKLVCRMFAVVRRGTPFVELDTYKN